MTQYAGAKRIAQLCRKHDSPVFLYVQDWDLEATKSNVRYFVKHGLPIVALSRFVQRSIFQTHGVKSTLLYPKLDYSHYRARGRASRRYVTIAHAHEVKGLSTFLDMAAALPDTSFLVVDGWGGWVPMPREVRQKIKHLRNVTLMPSQQDMRRVFVRTRVLVVPSLWNEAFARVVLEAQINGIPVIASRRGGLPEAVGDGGVIIDDYRNATDWVGAVRRLLEGPRLYERFSRNAIAHAERFSIEAPDSRARRLFMSRDFRASTPQQRRL